MGEQPTEQLMLTDRVAALWLQRDTWTSEQAWALLEMERLPACPSLRGLFCEKTRRSFMTNLRPSLPRRMGDAIFREEFCMRVDDWLETWLTHGRRLPRSIDRHAPSQVTDSENRAGPPLDPVRPLNPNQRDAAYRIVAGLCRLLGIEIIERNTANESKDIIDAVNEIFADSEMDHRTVQNLLNEVFQYRENRLGQVEHKRRHHNALAGSDTSLRK